MKAQVAFAQRLPGRLTVKQDSPLDMGLQGQIIPALIRIGRSRLRCTAMSESFSRGLIRLPPAGMTIFRAPGYESHKSRPLGGANQHDTRKPQTVSTVQLK